MKIESSDFSHDGVLPAEFAFGRPGDQGEPAVHTEPSPAQPTAAEARGTPGIQPEQKAPQLAFEPAARTSGEAESEPKSDVEIDSADNVVRLNPKAFEGHTPSQLKALKQKKKIAKAKLKVAKVKLRVAIKALEKAKEEKKKEKKAARKLQSAKKKAKARCKA